MGMASGYGPYGPSPAGYNPSPATTAGNTTANEDLSTSQFKENNVYITGQQVGFHLYLLIFGVPFAFGMLTY